MTVILAIKNAEGVVLAGDRRVTCDDKCWSIAAATPKIGFVGQMLVGYCGDTTPGEVLLGLKAPKRNPKEDAVTYLRKRVLPKIRFELNADTEYDWAAIVVLDGRIFEIDHVSVVEVADYYWAVGSGKAVAAGFLFATLGQHSQLEVSCTKAYEIATRAIEAAARYIKSCGDGCDVLVLT